MNLGNHSYWLLPKRNMVLKCMVCSIIHLQLFVYFILHMIIYCFSRTCRVLVGENWIPDGILYQVWVFESTSESGVEHHSRFRCQCQISQFYSIQLFQTVYYILTVWEAGCTRLATSVIYEAFVNFDLMQIELLKRIFMRLAA